MEHTWLNRDINTGVGFFPSGHDGTFMGGLDPNEYLKVK